ncbi:hypothetical protein FJZ31_10575 [Candidatus Poribacteria bacterium]|nr:hypothetical protein [Candidatus Poribacteria bacterium]
MASHSSSIIEQPQQAPAQANPPQFAVGDKKKFYAVDFSNQSQYIVDATLYAIGQFCYIFVEDSQWQRTVTPLGVEKVRRAFDDSTPADPSRGIYQIETETLGQPPDIDNDKRIYILLLDVQDFYKSKGEFVAGYFSPVNQQRGIVRDPNSGAPLRSNEIELLYIDTHPLPVGSADGLSVVAHEFQHLIHWRYDPNEEIWINEGCSDYAMFLCGYDVSTHVSAFEKEPDSSLVNWPRGMQSKLSYYGAAYLWMLYLHEHYGGPRIISTIIRNQTNGISSINAALAAFGYSKYFSQIFADWKVANYVDDLQIENGIYGYLNENPKPRTKEEYRYYPISNSDDQVEAWAADYISFTGMTGFGDLKLNFSGDSNYRYDVKVIEYHAGQPTNIRNMSLSADGLGQLSVSNFGTDIYQVILVPSLQPNADLVGNISSAYSYSAKQDTKVTFQTGSIPNPIQPRYWDIIAKPSDNIGADLPVITITTKDGQILQKDVPMKSISAQQELRTPTGTLYGYQLYLPPNVQPSSIMWQVFYSGAKVGEGTLEKRD